jgi:hypothetical protein
VPCAADEGAAAEAGGACGRPGWGWSALNPLAPRARDGYVFSVLDDASIPELHASVAVPAARGPGEARRTFMQSLKALWAYAGPGLLISVGYMDPGNWCVRSCPRGAAVRRAVRGVQARAA